MKTLKEQNRWKVVKHDGEYVIRGKRGVIALYSDGDLNVWIVSPAMAGRIAWKPLHSYDDGADYCRPVSDLDVACRYIKARKRRVLSPQTLETLRSRLATMRSCAKKAYVTDVSRA